MPRGRHYKRKKREGEVWHKGPPRGKNGTYLLCLRCKRGICAYGIRVHLRTCYGIRWCRICSAPFPCDTRLCPGFMRPMPRIPKDLIPYFYVHPGRVRSNTWRNDPARLALERPAHRWLRTILLRRKDAVE